MMMSVRKTTAVPARAGPCLQARGRNVRARANEPQNSPDDINDKADGDMKYVLREDMSNLKTNEGNPSTPGEAVQDTLEPRVRELRGKKLSKGTGDIGALMRFDGPAPELINSRLAMFGFVAALGAELGTHQTIFQQVREAPVGIVAASVILAIASFIPMIRGTKLFDDGAGEGLKPFRFNLTNELINGRAAMLGIALLIIYEQSAGKALFQ